MSSIYAVFIMPSPLDLTPNEVAYLTNAMENWSGKSTKERTRFKDATVKQFLGDRKLDAGNEWYRFAMRGVSSALDDDFELPLTSSAAYFHLDQQSLRTRR